MNADTDESEADADLEWQKIVKNRKRQLGSPKLYNNKRKAIVGDNQLHNNDQPSTSNKFAMLQNDDDDDNEDEADDDNVETSNTKSTPNPPPIYIPDVIDISKMVTNITDKISKHEFSYKCLYNNQVRIMVKTVDAYRTLVKYLEDRNISFHTFQLKQQRSYRVVLKGLHHSIPTSDIKAELIQLGHQVRFITNVRSRVTKEPLSMFYVDLDPSPNNKDIFNITRLLHAIVSIEAPRKTKEIVQCHRCQLFGHTKSYCRRQFSCVKCGLNHSTTECTKDLNSPARCVNCLKNHTANYKGCLIYKKLVQQRFQQGHNTYNNRQYNTFSNNAKDFPQLNNNNLSNTNEFNNNQSYSETLKNQNNNINNSSNNSMDRMDRMESMLVNLLNMITKLISTLCK